MAKYQSSGSSRVWVDDAEGIPRDLSPYVEEVGPLGTAVGWLDVTGLSDPAQRVIAGTRAAQEMVLRGLFDDKAVDGPDAVLAGVVGEVVTVSYGPAGSATGLRQISAEFLCLSYRITSRTGDKVRFEARFLQDGGATLGAWA